MIGLEAEADRDETNAQNTLPLCEQVIGSSLVQLLSHPQ
jgi:hypothetical protein